MESGLRGVEGGLQSKHAQTMLEVSCKELNKSFFFLPSGLAATQLALLSLSEEKTWALLFFGSDL